MKKMSKGPKAGVVEYRTLTVDESDAETLSLSVSSDVPYLRSFGYEVLVHTPEAIDMTRLLNGAPLLFGHDDKDQIGVIETAWLDGSKLRAKVRFSKSARGQEFEADVKDNIRRNVSVGYVVTEWERDEELLDDVPVYRATRWEPLEVSIVSVPADNTVGYGRKYKPMEQKTMRTLVLNDENEVVEIVLPDGTSITDPDEIAALLAAMDGETDTVETEADVSDEKEADDDAADEDTPEPEDEKRKAHTPRISIKERSRTMKNNLNAFPATVTLSPREQKQYSLSRALLKMADGKRDGFEFEVSQEISNKLGRDTNGFWMPTSVRAYNITDGASAGAFTFTEGGEFIDFLRNKAVVASLGASVLSLNARTALPRATNDLSAQWISEDGSGATFNSQSFDQVLLTPKKMATYTGVTREALIVASMDVEAMIRNNIYASFTTAFDKAALVGAGGIEPLGLLSGSGITSGSLLASGSSLSWAGALELVKNVAQYNADGGSLAYLSSPGVKIGAMATIKSGSTAEFIVDTNGRLGLYEIAHSNNLPASTLVFGDWSNLILAEFGAIEIIVDPYTSKHKGIVEVGATLLGDVGLKQPKAFSIYKNLKE